ncbi:MAG: type II toxin-antitoxin system VapC family toxin [Deltaproteobacteria bacterium]|nr:type II toxin-antitoxin system VapC family toxin [Deltaproteobacteria bacterium]
MIPVLDASVFVAAVSPTEAHHEAARRLYESHPRDCAYDVPSLFRLEVLAALARRGEPDELLDAVDALVRGPRFHVRPVDAALLEHAAAVVRTARLRAYDAVYAALALEQDAALFTLDDDLARRLALAYPQARVVTAPPVAP